MSLPLPLLLPSLPFPFSNRIQHGIKYRRCGLSSAVGQRLLLKHTLKKITRSMRRLSWGQAFGRESPSPAADSPSGSEAFGAKKSITYWGGICLLSNNLTGPGMVLLPGLFAGAGLTFPLLVTLLIAALSSFSVLFVAKMIQSIPGNSSFSQRIEFSKLIRRLFPKWLYVCAFFAMIFNLQVCRFMLI
jgi:hypothetical protein